MCHPLWSPGCTRNCRLTRSCTTVRGVINILVDQPSYHGKGNSAQPCVHIQSSWKVNRRHWTRTAHACTYMAWNVLIALCLFSTQVLSDANCRSREAPPATDRWVPSMCTLLSGAQTSMSTSKELLLPSSVPKNKKRIIQFIRIQ